MPLEALLDQKMPISVEEVQLSDIEAFVTNRHVAALAVWRRENYARTWMKFAVSYDSVLKLENKKESMDPMTRKTQKNNAMRKICESTEKICRRFGYEVPAWVTRVLYLYDYDLSEELREVPADSGDVTDNSLKLPVATAPQLPPKTPTKSEKGPDANGVVSTESYWFKRLDERLCAVCSCLKEMQGVFEQGSERTEALLTTLVEEFRSYKVAIDDAKLDGGDQALSTISCEKSEKSMVEEDHPNLDEQKLELREDRAKRRRTPKAKAKAGCSGPAKKARSRR